MVIIVRCKGALFRPTENLRYVEKLIYLCANACVKNTSAYSSNKPYQTRTITRIAMKIAWFVARTLAVHLKRIHASMYCWIRTPLSHLPNRIPYSFLSSTQINSLRSNKKWVQFILCMLFYQRIMLKLLYPRPIVQLVRLPTTINKVAGKRMNLA